ncbi:ATP-binding protein [Streptomyces sp. MRC013]|uniref:ATP-binding protein n=1 Tax=Streptomyces sp. MRC013 TaxID=2898276 RepID=UPI002026C4E1|nr:ATP-binding protein [Streptomyces sp. MRC013]URM89758.1 ATP-binding protein [Streptomyces sp. MRC013]
MSLPLTRRIARAALLAAAGAASVVGAAGSASAADLPKTADLTGGVTTLDTAQVTDTVGTVSRDGSDLASGKTAERAAPVAGEALDTAAEAAMPAFGAAAGELARGAGDAMGDASGNKLPDEPFSGGLPVSGPVG